MFCRRLFDALPLLEIRCLTRRCNNTVDEAFKARSDGFTLANCAGKKGRVPSSVNFDSYQLLGDVQVDFQISFRLHETRQDGLFYRRRRGTRTRALAKD